MNEWKEELEAHFAEAKDVARVAELIGVGASALGFDHWAYGLRLPLPFTRPRFFTISNYDPRWVQRYKDQDYLQVDPTVLHGCASLVPLVWDEGVISRAPQFWSEARSFGLRFGWAQSCFDGAGRVGMLSLARSSETFSPREMAAHDPLWRWLAQEAHLAMSARMDTGRAASRPLLTARQVEVLKWTADGKTCEEVAQILGISEHTVHFHVKNAVAALAANNKAAAVSRAAQLGLLR
ncbi:MAG: LuxR family transcriptional regulator [Alcaligenaceae bacterium]|nr:MAG: LuxR family transcriptional regulator [Alcaligenaceae bacterium]